MVARSLGAANAPGWRGPSAQTPQQRPKPARQHAGSLQRKLPNPHHHTSSLTSMASCGSREDSTILATGAKYDLTSASTPSRRYMTCTGGGGGGGG